MVFSFSYFTNDVIDKSYIQYIIGKYGVTISVVTLFLVLLASTQYRNVSKIVYDLWCCCPFMLLSVLSVRVGYAYGAGICAGGTGVSVLEELGLDSWAIAAHELGHRYGHQRNLFFLNNFFIWHSFLLYGLYT